MKKRSKKIVEDKVAVIKQKEYNVDEIKDKLIKTFSKINYKPKGKKILLKPNFLVPTHEEEPVTTKNEIIIAMIETLNLMGDYDIIISDSPGFSTAYNVAKKKGLLNLISRYENVTLRDYNSFKIIEGDEIKLKIAGLIDEVDEIINLARFKTHTFQTLTCATKNLFGLVYKSEKQKEHLKHHSKEDFGKMLFFLQEKLNKKVTLNLVDGIIGMQGNGPRSGESKRLGQIIISKDPILCDLVACEIILVMPKKIPYLNYALNKREYKYNLINEIDIIQNFKLPYKKNTILGRLFNIFNYFNIIINPIKEYFRKKPKINDKCIGCGVCARKCPANVIEIENKKAKIKHKKYIKCYVCHEMCPENAIDLKFRL
ncbi:MAG: DUF362 domain-containing protein [archaeon]